MENQQFMTIKEIANYLNLSERTIQRRAKKHGILLKQGESKNWTKEEVTLILNNDNTTVEMSNYVTKNDLKEFGIAIVKEMFSQMTPLLQQSNIKQISFKQDYYSVLGYMKYRNLDEARFSEMICYGKEASKISKELNKEIRKIPDERFGFVNSYHISVLEKLFEI